jgi:thiamine biosynthesis lipoprotein ApbE
VSDEFASLLRRSLALGAATGGAFDVTVGALTELWRDSETPPTPAAVAAARDRVGAARVRLDGAPSSCRWVIASTSTASPRDGPSTAASRACARPGSAARS